MSKKYAKTLKQNWPEVIAKAWSDEGFKKKLLSNPIQVLKDSGVEVPSDYEIHVHENKKNCHHLTLPEHPGKDFSQVELKKLITNEKSKHGCMGDD